MLAWLERRLGRLAIHNLTLYLLTGQIFFTMVLLAQPGLLDEMLLVPSRVLEGEVWRLLVFVFIPPIVINVNAPAFDALFLFFALYLFYLMGTALEQHWGAFRYNVFLLIGYLATIASVWIVPDGQATNVFIGGSVFLAFAFLYPDFVLHLFLILPVKIKWLALITWVMYGFTLLVGDWMTRMLVLASVANFLLFFWRDLIHMMQRGHRRMRQQSQAMAMRAAADEPFHRCTTCGRTEQTHRELEFRYCPDCHDTACYCMDHIHEHEHRVAAAKG